MAAMACASAPGGGTLPAGWRLEKDNTLVHQQTGLAFPARWDGFVRGEPRTRDDAGADVAIAYRDALGNVTLNLATYPRSTAPESETAVHFDRQLLALAKSHPGARVEENAPMNLPLGYAARHGVGAFLHWPSGEAETGSFLILIPRGDRFYLVDTVFPLDGRQETVEEAWKRLLAFLRTLEPDPDRV